MMMVLLANTETDILYVSTKKKGKEQTKLKIKGLHWYEMSKMRN